MPWWRGICPRGGETKSRREEQLPPRRRFPAGQLSARADESFQGSRDDFCGGLACDPASWRGTRRLAAAGVRRGGRCNSRREVVTPAARDRDRSQPPPRGRIPRREVVTPATWRRKVSQLEACGGGIATVHVGPMPTNCSAHCTKASPPPLRFRRLMCMLAPIDSGVAGMDPPAWMPSAVYTAEAKTTRVRSRATGDPGAHSQPR